MNDQHAKIGSKWTRKDTNTKKCNAETRLEHLFRVYVNFCIFFIFCMNATAILFAIPSLHAYVRKRWNFGICFIFCIYCMPLTHCLLYTFACMLLFPKYWIKIVFAEKCNLIKELAKQMIWCSCVKETLTSPYWQIFWLWCCSEAYENYKYSSSKSSWVNMLRNKIEILSSTNG